MFERQRGGAVTMENQLSAWPDVTLPSLTMSELFQAVESSYRTQISEGQCLGAAVGAERLKRHLDAIQSQCLYTAASLAASSLPAQSSYETVDGIESIGAEIGMALGLTRHQANDRVGESVLVCPELPLLVALVDSGDLDWRTVVAVHTRMRNSLQPGTSKWEAVQAALVQLLPGMSHGQALAAVQREIQKVDPAAARTRHLKERKDRCIRAFPLPDGMGGLYAKLTADQTMMIHALLDGLADACRDQARRAGNPDPRSHQERRADAFVAIFRSIHSHSPLPFVPVPQEPVDPFGGRVVPPGHPDAPNPPPNGAPAPRRANTSTSSRAGRPGYTRSGAPDPQQRHESATQTSDGSATSQPHTSTSRPSGRARTFPPDRPTSPQPNDSAPAARPETPRTDRQTPVHSDKPGAERLDQAISPHTDKPAPIRSDEPIPTKSGRPASPCSDQPAAPHRDMSDPPPDATSQGRPDAADQAQESVLGWWLPPVLPRQQGRKPHLVVTITADTLRGIDDLPGELQGIGAIPADLARELARQAGNVTVIRVDGQMQDASGRTDSPTSQDRGSQEQHHGPGDQTNCTEPSTRYKPRQSVLDQVMGRFQQCVHPSCSRPAEQCDVDHAIPFNQGGKSCPCNLLPLCRFHHRLKTHGGWTMRLTRPDEPYPTGTIEWRSRLGQHLIQPPPPLPGTPENYGNRGTPAPTETTEPQESADREARRQFRLGEWQKDLQSLAPRNPPAPRQSDINFGEPPF